MDFIEMLPNLHQTRQRCSSDWAVYQVLDILNPAYWNSWQNLQTDNPANAFMERHQQANGQRKQL